VLVAAAPVSRRVCTPDPAPSRRHARQPAAASAGHFSPDAGSRPKTGCRRPAGHPVTPSPRPEMTHRDEQSMLPADQKHPYNAESARRPLMTSWPHKARLSPRSVLWRPRWSGCRPRPVNWSCISASRRRPRPTLERGRCPAGRGADARAEAACRAVRRAVLPVSGPGWMARSGRRRLRCCWQVGQHGRIL